MEPAATTLLLILGLVAYSNYAHGTLGQWFKSKFFNATDPQNLGVSHIGNAGSTLGLGGIGNTPTAAGNHLTRPVPGPITSPFGVQRAGHTHAGADLQAAQGDPVAAANAGTVSAQTTGGDCGGRIDISRGDGLVTRYCHLSKFNVAPGAKVTAGQTIGLVGGASGNPALDGDATGPHLHFEVRINGTAVDPAPWIGG